MNKYKCLLGFLFLGFLGTVAVRSCSSCIQSKSQLSLGTHQGEASHEIGWEGICDSVRTSVVSPVPFWTSVPPHLHFHFDLRASNSLDAEKKETPAATEGPSLREGRCFRDLLCLFF